MPQMNADALILVGQLMAMAVACGLNLYAAVALLGIAVRLGWLGDLPPGLSGLENGLIIGSATALYVVEFVLDKVPGIDSLWDAVHTFIRPTAAALLALSAVAGQPVELQVAVVALASTAALAAHGAKAGFRVCVRAPTSPGGARLVSIAEDLLVVALAFVALRYPAAALSAAGAVLLLIVLVGPRLSRAFVLGARALDARLRGFFGGARWHEHRELPADLQGLLGPIPDGPAPPVGVRAAVTGLRGVAAYRNGWLVVTSDGLVFLHRSLFGPRRSLLPAGDARLRRGFWTDALQVRAPASGEFTIFLLKDGPRAELVLRELAAHAATVAAAPGAAPGSTPDSVPVPA
jgi:hypothetical protein